MAVYPVIKPKFNLKKHFCASPWNSVSIESDGAIYSCACVRWTNLKLGNLLEQSLAEIYQKSVPLALLRNSVINGTYDWCIEWDCNEITKLPKYEKDPFTELSIDKNVLLPTNITLAIDYNCNLKCPSCRSYQIFSDKPKLTAQQILNSLSEVYKNHNKQTIVMLDGAGDVFVSKAYEEFLFTDKLPKCWLLMILTNGNLISKKINEIKKIANQIDMITISLDAATKETYAITRGGSFENVIKGIEMLKEINVKAYLQFVLQKDNYKELLEYKKLANKYNIGYGVQKIDYREHMTENYWKNVNLDANDEVDYVQLKNYLTILKNDPTCNLDGGSLWLLSKLQSS